MFLQGLVSLKRPRVKIGIKRMGEVNLKPIRDACSRVFRSGKWDKKFGNWEEKSVELCSLWQKDISDPGWQPFKQEIINEKLSVGHVTFHIITSNKNICFQNLQKLAKIDTNYSNYNRSSLSSSRC